MSGSTGDPLQIKASYQTIFDDTARGRKKWQTVLGPAYAPVTEALLEAGGVREGSWVLDVGCGLGDPAIDAARRVGPTGRVVGIDLSKRELAIATERAKAEGLSHASFQVVDAEDIVSWAEQGFDQVLSRFGLSFIPELELALRGIHHVLMRGGTVAAASWGGHERVPFLWVARHAVSEFVGRAVPHPSMPGPFALGQPGRLEQALSSAGFTGIQGRRLTVVVELASVEAYLALLREATSLGHIVAESATVGAERVWAAVAEAAQPYADASGRLVFPNDVTVVSARR